MLDSILYADHIVVMWIPSYKWLRDFPPEEWLFEFPPVIKMLWIMWISSCTLFMWIYPVQCLWVFPPVQSSCVSHLNSGYAEFPPVHWLCWWSCVPVVVVCFHLYQRLCRWSCVPVFTWRARYLFQVVVLLSSRFSLITTGYYLLKLLSEKICFVVIIRMQSIFIFSDVKCWSSYCTIMYLQLANAKLTGTKNAPEGLILGVPHSQSGAVPMSSLSGVG